MSTAAMYLIFLGYLMVVSAAREDKKRLISDLMAGYNKLWQPEGDNGTALIVEHAMKYNRIVSLENGILTTDATVTLKWTDTSLRWDPKEYGDVRKITLPSRLLWKPDIVLFDSAVEYTGEPRVDINMVIQHDGQVYFISPVKLLTYCKINDDLYGVSNCTMKFGSWTQDENSIDLQERFGLVPGVIDRRVFEHRFNKDWVLDTLEIMRNVRKYDCCIIGERTQNHCCPEPLSYVDIVYYLGLKSRKYYIS